VARAEHEARRLCGTRTDRPFRGYKHPGLTKSKPRGSWAPYGPLWEGSREPSLADCQGMQSTPGHQGQPGPPGPKPRISSQVPGLFCPETPERPVILLANPGDEKLAQFRGGKATASLGKLATPAQYGRAVPPNLLLQSVGTPGTIHRKRASKMRESGEAVIAL